MIYLTRRQRRLRRRCGIIYRGTGHHPTCDAYGELGFQIAFLGHEFVLLVVEVGDGAGFGLEAVGEFALLGGQLGEGRFQLLAGLFRCLQVSQRLVGFLFQSLKI